MMDINIKKLKGDGVRTVKVPWTVACPVIYGAITAAWGATIGVVVGMGKGVWYDGKSLINKIKKK